MIMKISAKHSARASLLVLLLVFSRPGVSQKPGALREGFFSQDLYPALLESRCQICHVPGGLAAGTRLLFPAESARGEEIEAFGRRLSALVDRSRPGESLLLKKPTAREKHTGGRLIAAGSREEKLLHDWVKHLAITGDASDPATPQTAVAQPSPQGVLLRRLSHSQYNNTVRDLLGDQSHPADRFTPESFVNGFKNQAQGQSVPPLLAEAYGLAAERLAKNAFRAGDVNGLLPCRPTGAGDAACARKFIRKFGRRAFRRPLTEGEEKRLAGLFAAQARKTGDFLSGAQLVVEAVLQSPKFLFLVEQGGRARPYEVASRLAYFLWDTMPDDPLLDSAANGGLDDASGVERAARRMLSDPRARQGLDEFVSQWLRFDLVINAVKDRRVYPEFTRELATAMTEETRRLIADVVWNDRSFSEVFTAEYSFLNSDLAKLYGLAPPASEFEQVKFPAESERAGLFGHASFLTLTSKPEETSPTARGLFVREHLLCQTVPDPPPGTNSNLPPLDEEKPQTNEQRLSAHKVNPACAGCHTLIDPVGFGLERFDAIGKRREKQTLRFFPSRADTMEDPTVKPKTVRIDLDPKGVIEGVSDLTFSSPKELGRILAASPECQECLVRQIFRYAFGRKETGADQPAIQAGADAFRRSDFRFKDLVVSLVRSNEFLSTGPKERLP
ncbi:MAG: DUF1592 domain-containing protein [Bryobacterales bacterium]|nr:DUF1592 domain-containing protein [Bryobacterales bacterium]